MKATAEMIEDVRHHFPDLYEEKLNVKIIPTALSSTEAYRRKWFKDHKNDFIEIESWCDKDPNVEKGTILIEAALGGDETKDITYWGVLREHFEKERTEFGYVINPGRDKPKKLI
jgi:hypothetical protein